MVHLACFQFENIAPSPEHRWVFCGCVGEEGAHAMEPPLPKGIRNIKYMQTDHWSCMRVHLWYLFVVVILDESTLFASVCTYSYVSIQSFELNLFAKLEYHIKHLRIKYRFIQWVEENKIVTSWLTCAKYHKEKMYLLQQEKSLYIIICVYNKQWATECADDTRSCYFTFSACYLGTQFWELIIMEHFDKTLLKHFRMTKLAFRMLCNEIGPLVGPVMLFHRKVFFDAH